ncbi:ATP-grasp domain-containing protein [Heliophilum fasciatum]|uniref:ATP-grasp domain-containing protein n=1 Tax=Heliophilum fasciatum TaxID=35700 RepID=A0A4R2RXN8_9FIRM|nr:ATP-grasp domain-containing protein [Heliophilum fasciatum]MCW2277105.1 carbamoyl-phosphate synthase large subunit [Heliophilum fasciatum]TCP68258.1 ATP-grasp domain-containing protein [Heliophilum fasciatum]
MKDITVLSTACGAIFMPGFFRCLKGNGERNIRIIGCDITDSPFMNAIVDKYYQVSHYTDEAYVDNLLKVCRLEKVDILFPHLSMELDIVRVRLVDFERIGVKVAVSANESLSIANNKYLLYEIMKKNNIKAPKHYLVDSKKSLVDAATKLGYPEKSVCIKIAKSSGSRGVRILSAHKSKADIFLNDKPNSLYITLDEMCEIVDEFFRVPEMFAMEFLPGCEYTVDLLSDRGKVLYIAGRHNTVSSMSIAQESIVEEREDAFELCRKIVDILKLDGNIGFDFMLDENDNPVLTDLNPRITATIVLYAAAGINLPYLRVKQLLGEELPKNVKARCGVRLARKYNDLLIDESGVLVEI